MSHTVVLQPKADADVRNNAVWLRRYFSERTADRWLRGVRRAIDALARRAEQYPEADEAGELGIALRCKLHGRRPHVFRILFLVTDDSILVLRVRHAAQDRIAEDDL